MRRFLRSGLLLIAAICTMTAIAQQSTTVSGSVKNTKSKETVSAVSVTIKGTTTGTFTDDKGNFKLSTNQKLPFTLVFSSVGYANKEVAISSNNQEVNVDLETAFTLGDEVVVAASRLPERIIESPVSIERMGTAAVRNAAVPNYYDALANLKGVDMTVSSTFFRTVGTRGFNGSGNLRFNQLVDGMDNQAPGLNFSVGNIVGMTELDVDNVELLQGASSALYGPGGMNGTMLMNSKSPFKYQGLSFQIKTGVNHVDNAQRSAAPMHDWAVRWAKKVNDRFAFKISAQYVQAQDWQANDQTNLLRNNVLSTTRSGWRDLDPNYDGVSVLGDEASASMQALAQAVRAQVAAGGGGAAFGVIDNLLNAGRNPLQIAQAFGSNPALAPLAQFLPFLIPTSTAAINPWRNTFTGQNVSRTGYLEKDIVDYNAYNLKTTFGLNYKLSDKVEASFIGYWGMGTTVYTGADRYAIRNLKMGQYKFELKSDKWFLRAYTTQENSGDAYASTLAAVGVNSAWKGNTTWFQQYVGTYGAATMGLLPTAPGVGLGLLQAHGAARSVADAGRLLPGTPAFNAAFRQSITTPISRGGSQFADRTDLYHFEGQYNLSSLFNNAVEVLVGANYRRYALNSNGTIFADTAGTIGINEYGGYIQLQKKFGDIFKLTASGRYDKNQNFDGRFTPRITGLIKVAKDNNIRVSYQTAYRFPTAQDQWINLQTPSTRLIGGMPSFTTFFNFNNSPAYTAESIVAYRASLATGTPNPTLLKVQQPTTLKPEYVNSFEVGYRGMIGKKLLIDAYYYLSQYNDFIARVAVGRGVSAVAANAPVELASPFTTQNYSFVTNSTNTVKAQGWGVSAEWLLPKGYVLSGNVSSDKLQDVTPGLVTFFNAPPLRYNFGFSNPKFYKNWGFNVQYRWQDAVNWEGTFGSGVVPSFGVWDGQINYRFPETKNMLKIGASNIWNKYYRSAFGNPQVGGMYYVSFGYNVF
jgi:outer membrane receptor protein involved in Fe transport